MGHKFEKYNLDISEKSEQYLKNKSLLIYWLLSRYPTPPFTLFFIDVKKIAIDVNLNILIDSIYFFSIKSIFNCSCSD